LTDSKNQIDAIFSRESLDEHKSTSPCPPTIKEGPKKQIIELLDLRLALVYSTSSPEIELRVNRFRIKWNKAIKGEPPKPKLKKAPVIKGLLREACQKAQQSAVDARHNGPSISQFDPSNSPGSQGEPMTSQFFSQAPTNTSHEAQRENSKSSHVSLHTEAYLGLLKSSGGPNHTKADPHSLSLVSDSKQSPVRHGRTSIESGTHTLHKQSEPPIKVAFADKSTTNPAHFNSSDSAVDPVAIEIPSTSASIDLVNAGETANERKQNNFDASKKRQRDNTDTPSQTSRYDTDPQKLQGPGCLSKSNKRQRTNTGDVTQTDLNRIERVRNKLDPGPVVSELADLPMQHLLPDPWDGMAKIPTSDVYIPKEQNALFESLVWVEQRSGESAPLCHVPPRLLKKWNDVAQKKKLMAEKEEQRVEDPALTSPDIDRSGYVAESEMGSPTSEYSWPRSPERSPTKERTRVLPSDSPSPRKSRVIKNGITPTDTQSSAYQTAEDDDVDVLNGSHATSQLERELFASQGVPDVVAQRVSRSPKESTIISNETQSQSQNPGDNRFQERDHPKSTKIIDEQSSFQQAHTGLRLESPPAAPGPCHPEFSGDESDEAEMETSIPYGLGASIPPSSQPEQQIESSGNSSGLSLPRLTGDSVQVVETPAVQSTRSPREKEGDKTVRPELSITQQSSSQAAKTSSQSRIFATYHSQESYTQSDPSQEAPNPSLPIENESLRVDVLGTQTQTSNSHPASQETPQSHTEVVLDSSKTAQRQWGSSLFGSQTSGNPSSFPFLSSHPHPKSQINDLGEDSMRELSSLDGVTYLPDASQGISSGWTAPDTELPSKSPKTRQSESTTPWTTIQKSNGELVARRQSFIDKTDQTAQALMFYEKFCDDYPSYSGDFAHFIEMCAKLQGLRKSGALKRSFLWDDFVIVHLEDYQRHMEENASQESKTLKYEEFFCSSFSKPQHKKRSLTIHAVNVAASQFFPPGTTRSSIQMPSCPGATQNENGNISFTASLVDKLSDLHARSFGDTSPTGISHGPCANADMPPATKYSVLNSAGTLPPLQVKLELDSSRTEAVNNQTRATSSSGQNPALSSSGENMYDSTQNDQYDTDMKSESSDIDMSEADESQEIDRSHHRTASIELGDDSEDRLSSHISPPASATTPAGIVASIENVQREPQRPRPWFRSLRNIFPTGPVWSDDPNTPFKRWAREDQNVLQELNRRGGAKIQLDDKGVICRPIYK
jgi:hypothetical protein